MLVRKGKKEDLSRILELIKELAVYEHQPEAVTINEADLLKEGFGENPLFDFFVAVIDNQIVGMALFYYRFSTWKGRTLHLEDLIVDKKYRQKGIGEQLFNAVLKIAQEQNVGRMEWEALEWNTPALNFYKKYGANFDKEWLLCKMTRKSVQEYVNENL
ncbi:MAG: GNAT family N-acetyltransferase [Flavobacteriales bacterium]